MPGSLRAMVRWMNEDSAWQAWGGLGYSVKTDQPAFNHVLGSGSLRTLPAAPGAGKIFNEAMISFTTVTGRAVAKAYDFSVFNTIVDVGGGHGALLATIAAQHPGIAASSSIGRKSSPAREPFLASQGITARIDTAAGNFLENVPPGADAYIMKHIIHDWDDARSVTILSNCQSAVWRSRPARCSLSIRSSATGPSGIFRSSSISKCS